MWNWADNKVLQLDGQQDNLTLSEVWGMQCPWLATNLEIQGLGKSAMFPTGFSLTGSVNSAFHLQYPTSLFDGVLVFTGSYSQKLFTYYPRTAQVINLEIYETRIASHLLKKKRRRRRDIYMQQKV